MLCYLIYQYVQVFLRFADTVYLTANPTSYGYNETTVQTTIEQEVYGINIIFNWILFLCQMIIALFITKYYKLLPSDTERRRIQSYIDSSRAAI